MKDALKKIGILIALAAYLLALIGSTGYLLYDHHVLFAIASLLVDGLAVPSVIKLAKMLVD